MTDTRTHLDEISLGGPDHVPVPEGVSPEIADAVRALYTEGTVGKKGAFSRAWATDMAEDIYGAFHEMRDQSEADCREIVELGFDIPFPGAKNQPWHRDFPVPEVTREHKVLNSLAINATAVDTEPDMGPFEIAPGTQFDDDPSFNHGMFPPETWYPRFEERAVRKFPKRGDISIRSALTIHRGTASQSDKSRPVLVLGVDAPGAGNGDKHDMAVSKTFWETLPESVRAHLRCPVVDQLTPITQKHDIEGLVMG